MFTVAPCTTARREKQHKCSSQMNKQNIAYTYRGISSALKGKEFPTSTTTWMNLVDIVLREVKLVRKWLSLFSVQLLVLARVVMSGS